MSKVKVYPWTDVASDYFGKNAIDPSGNPSKQATKLSTDICGALLAKEISARDKDGSPAPEGFLPVTVTSLHGSYRYVYPADINVWLKSRGYLKIWSPSAEADDLWKDKAKEYADDIWQREVSRCRWPTKQSIAKEIEGRFKREKVVSTTGKDLTADNILRNGLSGWKQSKPD